VRRRERAAANKPHIDPRARTQRNSERMVIALPARNQPAAAAHAQPPAGSDVDSERRRRSRYHVAIKHAQRSASCARRRHGGHFRDSKAARRRATGRPSGAGASPGARSAGSSCSACGTRRSRARSAHRRAACSAAGAARSTAPGHGSTADSAAGAPRHAAASRAAFQSPRCRHRSRHRTWTEGANGRRSGDRETAGGSSRT